MQLTEKKCTKSVMHMQSCCFALSSYYLFEFLIAAACILIVIGEKQNILRANSIALADSFKPKRIFNSSVVPLFLDRKVENESFPCTHKLGERTGQV